MRTGTFYWETTEYHSDNTFTLNDWLNNQAGETLIITFLDGNYCEARDDFGNSYTLMASGNGDGYSHKIEIKEL